MPPAERPPERPAALSLPSERARPIMMATLRIIGRGGLDGVTHRAVAAEAGLSLGAVTHHFGARDDLVEMALRFAVAREVERLRAFALRLRTRAFDADAWIDALSDWYARDLAADGETHIACYEAFLAAARHPRYRPIVEEWFETWHVSAELAFRAGGSSAPGRHARIFVSAVTGEVLRQLAEPTPRFKGEMAERLKDLARGLLSLGC